MSKKFISGGDQIAISKIVKEIYGDHRAMFDAHGWEWTGQRAMSDASKLIKDFYGSIRNFEKYKTLDALPNDPFEQNPSVWIKAFHGFHPPSWGCVGWRGETRRNTIEKATTAPFIMAIWVTESASKENRNLRGKLAGFYEMTHQTGRRAEFMEPWQDKKHEKGKWEYSFRARRAWYILPEFRPILSDFYPDIIKRVRATANWAEELPEDIIEKLKALPRREIRVYGVNRDVETDISMPTSSSKKGYVRGGASRRIGYSVGEPKYTEKELYILQLNGDTDNFLGYSAEGKNIIKVGLSLSPETRRATFQKTLPKGAYNWQVLRTTRLDGFSIYPDYDTAEAGEMAMKKFLGEDITKHLGGEFYLADDEKIEQAWTLGRTVALKKMKEHND